LLIADQEHRVTGPPTFSVVTAGARADTLERSRVSLVRQTRPDWEWIVVTGADCAWQPPEPDGRVRRLRAPGGTSAGAALGLACSQATGALLVELADGDELVSTALDRFAEAFEHPDCGLAYSHFGVRLSEPSPDSQPSEDEFGIQRTPATVEGHPVVLTASLAPTPHNVSHEFAPGHLVAYRRSLYEQVGGYDAPAGGSRHDLICRMYQAAEFRLVGECLCLPVSDPTEGRFRAVSDGPVGYRRHALANALAWTARHRLRAIDIAPGRDHPAGFSETREVPVTDPDALLESLGEQSSVGTLRLVDVLQRAPDKVLLLNEAYRVLAHGGVLFTLTPSTDGRGAFQDPGHRSFFNENSFWYYTDRRFARFAPDLNCRFQVSRLTTFYPNGWHENHKISYVAADLVAVKDGARNGGPLRI
jgi:SAM-dependent methyltransferase